MSHYTMRDAGKEMMHLDGPVGPNKEKYYQHISFEVEQLPEISMWEPGEKYTLVIEVVQKSHNIDKDGKNVRESAGFEITKVGAVDSYVEDVADRVKKTLNIK